MPEVPEFPSPRRIYKVECSPQESSVHNSRVGIDEAHHYLIVATTIQSATSFVSGMLPPGWRVTYANELRGIGFDGAQVVIAKE